MKTKILGTVFISLIATISLQAQVWVKNYDYACSVAKNDNKLMLIDFYADWCPPCKQMDRETWSNTEVRKAMQNVISVKVDIDTNKSLASNYSIKDIPTILITDAFGNKIYKAEGMQSEQSVIKLLSCLPKNTNDLNSHIEKLVEDSKNADYNLATAKCYQELALSLNKKGKEILIRSSPNYLSKASKFYKKQKNTIKQEEVELLKCYSNVIIGRSKAALGKIEKTGLEKIHNNNRSLAYFVAAQACSELEMLPEAKEMLAQLKASENSSELLKQLEKNNSELFK